MKFLSGFFSLSGFLGILAAGFLMPKTPPVAALAREKEAVAEPEDAKADVLKKFNTAAKKGDWEAVTTELQGADVKTAIGAETVVILERSLQLAKENVLAENGLREEIGDLGESLIKAIAASKKAVSNRDQSDQKLGAMLKKMDRTLGGIEKRLVELEKRPVPEILTPPVEVIEEPKTPAPKEPAPRPTPVAVSLGFAIGSLNFSEAAAKKIKKAAAKMTADSRLVIRVRGSATGFSAALGKGRADAVKAKFAEHGVSEDRISVSSESSSGSDAVSITFRKKATGATTNS